MQTSLIIAMLLATPEVTTAALKEDPPLPGESTARWPGLDGEKSGDETGTSARALDENSAVRIALENNRDLRATLREVGIAEGRLRQARALPNPELEAEKPPEPETELELGIEYDLTDLLLAPMRSRAASADLEASRQRAAAAALELGFAVRAAFHSVQSIEQRLGVARRALDAFAAARDTARALFAAGNVPELETATQDAAYERARVVVAGLAFERVEARERLNRLLGAKGTATSWRIGAPLAPVPVAPRALANLEARAVEASLELRELRSRIDAADRRRGLSRAEGWLPDVSVGARAARIAHGGAREEPRREWGFGAGVTVSVPLFDHNGGTTRAYAAEVESLRERYQGTVIDLQAAAREAAARLSSAHARARHYQDVVLPAHRRVTKQTLLQYNAMQVGVFQLLLARREELEAELAYIETLREHWTAVAAVDALAAGRRPGAVASATGGAAMNTGAAAGGGH